MDYFHGLDYFNAHNTEGYTATQLAELNVAFRENLDEALEYYNVEEPHKSFVDWIGERTLISYDDGKASTLPPVYRQVGGAK